VLPCRASSISSSTGTPSTSAQLVRCRKGGFGGSAALQPPVGAAADPGRLDHLGLGHLCGDAGAGELCLGLRSGAAQPDATDRARRGPPADKPWRDSASAAQAAAAEPNPEMHAWTATYSAAVRATGTR
jgi:hypothetical protein